MTVFIDNIKVTAAGFNPEIDELKAYVKYVREHVKPDIAAELASVTVTACPDGCVDVSYTARGPKFERIRRITGYLVGTVDRWNDAKQAEEKDRVKHNPKV